MVFPDGFYNSFATFCDQGYILTDFKQNTINAIITVCSQLSTPLLMYFMQNLYRKNTPLFEQVSQEIKGNQQWQILHDRCQSFEKNITLTRVCAQERLVIIESVISELMGECEE